MDPVPGSADKASTSSVRPAGSRSCVCRDVVQPTSVDKGRGCSCGVFVEVRPVPLVLNYAEIDQMMAVTDKGEDELQSCRRGRGLGVAKFHDALSRVSRARGCGQELDVQEPFLGNPAPSYGLRLPQLCGAGTPFLGPPHDDAPSWPCTSWTMAS